MATAPAQTTKPVPKTPQYINTENLEKCQPLWNLDTQVIDEMINKIKIKTRIMKRQIREIFVLINYYWCNFPGSKLVERMKEYERTDKMLGDDMYRTSAFLFATTLPGLCTQQEYRDDPICVAVENIVGIMAMAAVVESGTIDKILLKHRLRGDTKKIKQIADKYMEKRKKRLQRLQGVEK